MINKLHEFMHEKHPGVHDMASEVFLKSSKAKAKMFTMDDNGEPYV